MPQHEEHCEHAFKRYGVRGDEIHSWMDEPSAIMGGSHRKFRHNLEDMDIAIGIFGKIYGEDMVRNIFLDHLRADSEEDCKNKNPDPTKTEPYLDTTLEAPIKIFNYKRGKRAHRATKISFGLKKGCSMKLRIEISGGNNDVKINGNMVSGTINQTFITKPSPMMFSNCFSTFTDKHIVLSWIVTRGLAYSRKFTEDFVI